MDDSWGPEVRLSRDATWESVTRDYRHWIPDRFNIGTAVAHSQDPGSRGRVAILQVLEDGSARAWTFGDLEALSNRLANALVTHGIGRGDRVAVWLPQSFELAVAHVAAYKLGAVVVPLFINFGRDAVVTRVAKSEAKAMFVTPAAVEELVDGAAQTPSVELLVVPHATATSTSRPAIESFWPFLNQGDRRFTAADTRSQDPAFLCFTSGTTGPPKGALHAQRVLLGSLSGISFTHDLAPRPGDLFWTPADWGWMGGLFDVLFPALYWGLPVVAHRMPKFDPEQAYDVLERYGVQNAFIPPTALRLMKLVDNPGSRWSLNLRTIASGGEALGGDTLEWAEQALGVHVNEFYGQTECNLMLGNCADLFERRPGSMGRVVPGRDVQLLDAMGNPVGTGEEGELVAGMGDPIMMLGYWADEEATKVKFADGVMHTGDLATRDEDGYFYFVGRNDDVISSAGYRIGPTDIENAIMRHPAVQSVAVIGKPDDVRGEVVKAVVVLRDSGAVEVEQLTPQIQTIVRAAVGGHAYPRDIEYVDELPMTSTGKIRRAALREIERARLTEASDYRCLPSRRTACSEGNRT